jgi:hypothetical protein
VVRKMEHPDAADCDDLGSTSLSEAAPMTDDPQDLRRQLEEAHRSRALVYAAFYDDLYARHGPQVAEEVMTAAI